MAKPPLAHAVDWLVPHWPAPPGVHALCTTRSGGVSQPPYGSLNLGTHVGDDPSAVQINRQRLHSVVQATSAGTRPVFFNQVHGDGVVHVNQHTPDATEADACVATGAGVACTIMVADCLPVLFAHTSGAVVGAAHAGWRGLLGTGGVGVLESLFKCFEALVLDNKARTAIKKEANEWVDWSEVPGSTQAADAPLHWAHTVARHTLVWLGPCIGPTAFEVGSEVRAAFCEGSPAAGAFFTARPDAPGKYLCDLAGLARHRLQLLGITRIYGNDSTAQWCTVANPSQFFSHRRDSAALGGSGRFAACIWRD